MKTKLIIVFKCTSKGQGFPRLSDKDNFYTQCMTYRNFLRLSEIPRMYMHFLSKYMRKPQST